MGRGVWSLLAMAVLILLWAAVTVVASPKAYISPPPWDVAARLWTSRTLLLDAAWPTISEVVLGYALGVAIAVPLDAGGGQQVAGPAAAPAPRGL